MKQVYMMKKISMETLGSYENGHSEDDAFHTLLKLKILRVILFSLWKFYLEIDWSEEESQCQKIVVVIFHIL